MAVNPGTATGAIQFGATALVCATKPTVLAAIKANFNTAKEANNVLECFGNSPEPVSPSIGPQGPHFENREARL